MDVYDIQIYVAKVKIVVKWPIMKFCFIPKESLKEHIEAEHGVVMTWKVPELGQRHAERRKYAH